MRNPFSRTPAIPPNSVPLFRTNGHKDKVAPADFFRPENGQALRNLVIYSMNAFSVENVIAYSAMAVFKNAPTFAKAMYIYTNFVASSAALEVNLSGAAVTGIKSDLGLTGPAPAHADSVSRAVFDKAMDDLGVNMMDTLDRHLPVKQIGNIAYYTRVVPTISAMETQQAIRGLCGAGFMMPQTMVAI